ncbi:ABC transporter substrate-binding protein [Sphingomonas jatrophae]|uniref:Peptide/nickel transport system substrate-binding protein n=1 Tax=Sphingomonas jatrophae TaxID=1166337 RepID=A0A1I6KYA5_9SPHN|nr:ABC transporter substrate-binding protein [Sphingomonas jatrophae]SFR96181.1 peptide/nickel transport system substrate-binding protein [Sphingomonas jatrophae]
MRWRPLAPLLAALLSACGSEAVRDERPLAVSIVGPAPQTGIDPDRQALTAPTASLLSATAQGLVRFDGNGQIEPGLAIRWDVSDDGLYYTFRLRDGSGIDAEHAARRLRAAVAARSRNPLRPVLLAVDEVVAVTPEVLEIRLAAPRPNLLQLLAQPDLAIRPPRGATGGPMRIVAGAADVMRLLPVPDADTVDVPPPSAGDEILLRGEPAALALARFRAGAAAVVTGGTFADLALARAAAPEDRVLRFDPAPGLFGLQVARDVPFLRPVENRRALAMAIDRERIVTAFARDGWRATTTLLPTGTEIAVPAVAGWEPLSLPERAAQAAATVRAWRADGPAPRLRVALPPGPGSRLLFTLLAIDWRHIGVEAEAVPLDAPADLRLVDQVAPGDLATWYLRRFACGRAAICSETADQALEAARITPSIPERLRLIAQADAALATAAPFIPLATPLRWSLVAPALRRWHDNPRAVHPLYTLRRAE